MRKIILMVILILSVTGTVFAADITDNELDAKKVINSIKEIRYNIEAGVNIRNYEDIVSKAGIEYRKYVDKYPEINQEIYPKSFLSMMLDPYSDAGKVWHNSIYQKYSTLYKLLDNDKMSLLFAKYPILKTKLTPYSSDGKVKTVLDGTELYWYEDVMKALWAIASGQEKILDIKPQ